MGQGRIWEEWSNCSGIIVALLPRVVKGFANFLQATVARRQHSDTQACGTSQAIFNMTRWQVQQNRLGKEEPQERDADCEPVQGDLCLCCDQSEP